MRNEAKNFKVGDLKTYHECQEAIEAIEGEPANVIGGLKAWASGYATELNASALNKIKAIEAKCDKYDSTDDEGNTLPNLSAACRAFNEIG